MGLGEGGGEEKPKRTRNSLGLSKEKAQDESKRSRVHAQRKFAQGAGGLSPHVSPIKEFRVRPRDNGSSSSSSSSGPTVLAKGERPKTEDFLTFLCLRGTEHLPPELDFFNQVTVTSTAATSDDSFGESDEDKRDPEVDKNGVARKSVAKKNVKEKKKVESGTSTPVGRKKDGLKKDQVETGGLSRAQSRDSASSVERTAEKRQTRSKAETASPNSKASAKNESDRGQRARARGIAKQKDESESSDDSSSEVDEPEDKGGRRSKVDKSESEADADEEASSRESSQRPNTRKSEGGLAKAKASPLSRLQQREARSNSHDSSGSKESIQASVRPSRKTKEAAKNYLNLLGQKLASRRKDDEGVEPPSRQRREEEWIDENKKKEARREEEERKEKTKEEEEKKKKEEEEIVETPSPVEEEKSNDSSSKSPKGERKREVKKEKKEKKKNKTSLKDLQNILLEEAKRNIADSNPLLSAVAMVSGGSPADSDTPESEERITISHKTGYINVKPRVSIDNMADESSFEPSSPARRSSLSGPNGRRLSKSSDGRTSTPPRKILPKTEDTDRSTESPANRTNHLPVGVMGAAGLSSRMSMGSVVMSKSTIVASSNMSSPVTIIGSDKSIVPVSMQTLNIPGSVPLSVPGSIQSVPLNIPDPIMSQTIIVPGGQQNQIRMPLQVSTIPLQVGMQSVDLQNVRQAVQVGVRPSTGQIDYQGIPILSSGVQFVQQNQLQQQQQQQMSQTIVTVPNYVRPGYIYSQPILNNSMSLQNQGRINQTINVSVSGMNQLSTNMVPLSVSQAPVQEYGVATLPQTITMPSGTTIQYNVTPVSLNQPISTGAPVSQSRSGSIPAVPVFTASTSIIATNNPPLLSPGPPTLSPQISARSIPSTAVKHVAKLDNGPPLLTPPVRKSEQLTNPTAEGAEVQSQPLRPLQSQGGDSAFSRSTTSHSNRTTPAQAVIRTPSVHTAYTQANTYPNMAGSYPAPLQVDPYQGAAHHTYQSPYHQPSPSGSYHSPQDYIQGIAMGSPHHNPLGSPNRMGSSHGNPMGSPGSNPMLSPHNHNLGSPNHHPMESSPHRYPIGSPPLYASAPPLASPAYPGAYQPTYPASTVQYNYPSQPAPPPPAPIQHSPLTPSSSQYRNLEKSRQEGSSFSGESKPQPNPVSSSSINTQSIIQVKEESLSPTRDIKPPETILKDSKPSTEKYSSMTKKKSEKFGKSKTTSLTHKPITHFNVEDDKSSPYAFDFESSEATPQIPFRKSSSPLKPPSMIKKSKVNLAAGKGVDRSWNTPVSETSKPQPGNSNSRTSSSNREDRRQDEDGSSSDNETTYFIPLQTSGQSFGVAVKLGTDGPSGPNQKVIMTAKLVTNPSKKPMNAKILGSKTTESKSNHSPLETEERLSSTPVKEPITPRKLRMPVASPISPSYPLDSSISPISDKPRPRMRRTDDGIDLQPPSVQSKEPFPTGGKKRPICLIGNVNTGNRFPRLGQHAQMMEAPTFRPTEAEFQDPIRYIQKIRRHAEQFGICKIVPPPSFKPECNVEDDLRFTAYNQYINRMFSRWGPNSKETAAIKKYLETQNVDTRAHPLVGGLEVDLPALYHAVQSFGGLSEVIQKKKWGKIAEYLRVARGTHASGSKLDDMYVKWLLPYDTLSNVEREELLRLVEEEWAEQSRDRAEKSRLKEENTELDNQEDEDEEEEEDDMEAVVKGKSTSLAAFYRLSRNLLSTVFRDVEDPAPHEAEDEYWKIVADKDVHMQVCQGSIDTGILGYGFPVRNSQYSTHPWNLKNLTKNQRSVLQAMGSVMGVTVPTLHVGMLFTSSCWYRDPHGLPWIEYLHTGSAKIWYGIPDHHSLAFYTAMKQLVPSFCKNRKIWLPSDTTMVSPSLLVKHGVSVSRAVQQPGQFIVIFPRSYTSSVSTGYCVSESVYFATSSWLDEADIIFQDIKDSMEPMMFPLEKMLFAVSKFKGATKNTLLNIKPKIALIVSREIALREKIAGLGVKKFERLKLERKGEEDDEYECAVCNANLYLSLIGNEEEESTFCLLHGIQHIQGNKKKLKQCKFMFTYTKDELKEVMENLDTRIRTNNFAPEPVEDEPLKSEDVEVGEEDDHVDEGEVRPRERALPSYIKKEKPIISSESDEDEEDGGEGRNDHDGGGGGGGGGGVIGPEDYTDFQDEEDIPVIEALFQDDDEVIRPSLKRTQPKVRKPLTESESDSEPEIESKPEEKAPKMKKPTPKPKKMEKAKTADEGRKKKEMKAVKNEKATKRKKDESESEEEPKKKILKKKVESKDEQRKGKGKQSKESKDKVEKGGKVMKGKTSRKETKEESSEEESLKKTNVSKSETKSKAKSKQEESNKSTKAVKKPATKSAKETKKRPAAKEEVTRKRKTKKRKAKTIDAADKFNLLDIILTETDDEMPVSASEEGSESSSSDDEWK